MRTEAEFLTLVESRIAAIPSRSPSLRRTVLIASAAAVLIGALFTGMTLHRRTSAIPDHHAVSGEDTLAPLPPETAPAVVQHPAAATETRHALADTGSAATDTVKQAETVPEPTIKTYPVPATIVYQGKTYDALANLSERFPLTEADLGEKLGEDLYALAGISPDYMLVYAQDGLLWRYFDRWYQPASLGALIEDLNLTKTLKIGSMYYETIIDGQYRSWRVEGLEQERLFAMLFAYPASVPQELWHTIDPEAMVKEYAEQGIVIVSPPYDPSGNYTFPRSPSLALSFSIDLPKFGYSNISLSLSDEDNGWLWTNILSSGNYFATSPDLVEQVMAYARACGTWIDTTPVYPSDTVKIPETVYPETVTCTSAVTSGPSVPLPTPPTQG